jgi:hypothetical protein
MISELGHRHRRHRYGGQADAVLKFIRAQKHKTWLISEVVKGKGETTVV